MFDYNKNAFASAGWKPCSREQFDQIISDPLVAMVADELANLAMTCDAGRLDDTIYQARKASLKRRLPAFAFHAHFPDGRRKNEGAQPSGLCMIDLDHLMAPRTVWNQLSAAMQAEAAQQAVPTHDDNIRENNPATNVASANDASNPSANIARQDSWLRRECSRSEESSKPASPLAQSHSSFFIFHSSLKKDPCRESLCDVGLSPRMGGGGGGLLLAHITPSGRGLRLVFRLPESYRCQPYSDHIAQFQEEITRWIESIIHEEGHSDPHVKDLARISFAVPRSYILHLDERLFENEELGTLRVSECNPSLLGDCRAGAVSAEPMRNEECLTANEPATNEATPFRDAHPLPVGATLAVARIAPQGGADTHDNDIRDVPSRRATARVAPTIRGNDPAADPLQGLMGQIGQAVAESASPPQHFSPFTEVGGQRFAPAGEGDVREGNPSANPAAASADSPLSSLLFPSRGWPMRTSLTNTGNSWEDHPPRESATPNSTSWPTTCATSATSMPICFNRSCPPSA